MFRHLLDSILITILVFLFMWGLSKVDIFDNLEMLNPVEHVLNDFDLTDVVYSKIRKPPAADTTITVVNIGELGREGLTEMIKVLNKYEPKVIALDAFFRSPLDSTMDHNFAQALSQVDNLVMASQGNFTAAYEEKLAQNKDKNSFVVGFDTLEHSNALFTQYAEEGHVNLITTSRGNNQDFVTVRTFNPVIPVNGVGEPAFSVKIAELVDSGAAQRFLERDILSEYINYRGNVDVANLQKVAFMALDVFQVFEEDFDPSVIRNKIVILGYMGKNMREFSYIDKFYTPLNDNYIGKATLDMYGVVVHANIVSMILNEEYIDTFPEWGDYLVMLFITLLSTMLFSYFFHKVGYWYDALTIFFQLAIFILIVSVGLFAFEWYRLRIEINLAIVAVILSGIFVEIYYGLLKKLFFTLTSKRKKVKQTSNETI